MHFFSVLLLVLPGLNSLYAQTTPIIMERADSLAVSQRGGHMVLKGNVRFRHDTLQFFTQNAVWNRSLDQVQCTGGFRFVHPGGNIEAQSGSYTRRTETAHAKGQVVARDSAGELSFFGEELIYQRRQGILTLPAKPLIHRYYRDSLGNISDTLAIRGRRLIYDQKNEIARAFDSVIVTRDDLVVTTDTGIYDRANNRLLLWGNPTCRMRHYVLKGDSMVIELDGESLKSVLVLRNGWGSQNEPPSEGKPGQQTEVQGDTLYAEFAGKRLVRLRASGSALGTFFEDDLRDFVNRLAGDSLTIDFNEGEMQVARARGSATSRYHYVKNNRRIQGVNYAAGDSITIDFRDNKISRLHIRGNTATGVYQDLVKKDGTLIRQPTSATTDTAAVPTLTQDADQAPLRPPSLPATRRQEQRQIIKEGDSPPAGEGKKKRRKVPTALKPSGVRERLP